MDHILVRLGKRQVLVADVCSSADGDGVGYGILLKRIDKVLWYAQIKGASVFYPREARTINTAVFRLHPQGVDLVARGSWQAAWLTCVWAATAPFRLGAPLLWAQRTAARLLLGPFYRTIEESPRVPQVLRRLVVQPRPLYRRLRQANREYAKRSSDAWKERFRHDAKRTVRAAVRGREEAPSRAFALPLEGEREALACAARVGITPADRLITVHVRETGYRADAGLRQREWDTLRNARIDTYADAFAALVERGFTVVRLGDRSMSPVQQRGVVDLATATERSEWLEVWCVLRSAFLIGSDSGPSWLAFLLGVPVLTVNALHFRDIERFRDRFICKRARNRSTGEVLSLSDMLTPEYLRHGLDTDRYEHLDNTAEEIREAALDMLDVVSGDTKLTRKQRAFNGRLMALAKEVSLDWTGLQGIGFAGKPRGALARPFAARYL